MPRARYPFYLAYPLTHIGQTVSGKSESPIRKLEKGLPAKGSEAKRGDTLTADEEVRDPFVLEFLGLKDEYSENYLEEALVR